MKIMVIGEIIGAITLVSAFVTTWVTLNLKIQKVQIDINNLKNEHVKDMQNVEKTFNSLIQKIEKIVDNNVENHTQIIEKIDNIKKDITDIKIVCAGKKNC